MAARNWTGTTSGDWAVTTNWAESTVPVAGDDVIIGAGSVSITASLNQSAVTLASLTISAAYTGSIGSATAYLQVGATLCTIGVPSSSSIAGVGSGRIKLNFGSVQTTCTVYGSGGTSTDSGLEPIRLLGTHASNKLYVFGGTVGVATTTSGEVSTFSEVDLGNTVAGSTSVCNLGAGCTLTAVNQTGGTLTLNAAATTVTQSAGTLTTQGIGAYTTVTAGGTAYLNGTGTITTLNVPGKGRADFSRAAAARTVTTLKAASGAAVNLDNGALNSVTITNGIQPQLCRLGDLTVTTWLNSIAKLS